jgi:diacylglycerol kinase
MFPEPLPSKRSWPRKFRDAFRGVREGVQSQSSFIVHFAMAIAVVVVAAVMGLARVEWCILLTCITLVLTAEMFNSALESMARAITGESNPHLGNALDIGSAAVLVAAVGASSVGLVVFVHRLGELAGWWN